MAVRKTAEGLRLKRWFKEDWRTPKGNKGYDKGENTFRPTKRISKDTPSTWSELSKGEKRRAKIEKDTKGRVSRYKKKKTMAKGGMSTPAWTRKEGKSKSGGLNKKGIASYRRANPGSKLSLAVTTKPSKLKSGSKASKRRNSFCARMGGVKGPMKDEKGRPTRKALALKKWNCKHGCTMNVKRKSTKKRKYQDGGVNNNKKEDFSMFSANMDTKNKPVYKPSIPTLTDKQKKMKEKYPELYEARHGGGKNTMKVRLQSVQHGMDKMSNYDPTGVSSAISAGAGYAEGRKGGKELLRGAADVVGGKLKTGKKALDNVRATVGGIKKVGGFKKGGMVYAPKGFHWMKKGDGKYKLMKHGDKPFKKHPGASLNAKFPIQKKHNPKKDSLMAKRKR